MWKLTMSFVVVFVVAGAGSTATFDSIPTWYAELTKPPFNPPNFIFGPVWTILYAFMAISLFLIWKGKQTKEAIYARKVFVVQLGLNFLWSFVFFGAHQLGLAVITILALWASILYTILLFKRINKTAANLLVPYLLWVSFATLLNVSIFLLN